ncbi:MAG: aspartate carbamoyltransferase [Candidatus Pacearchaeota archaeon]|jgi:aspartate carbamoyltransferase catalytic subunit|nr:aspartate carbamoyltransferase [Candidatus Pacearchaeota archaeon]|tara:strand:+ start:337 stop:1260 length:924 start_codon:yes stop_codon:yes gene_type:complete
MEINHVLESQQFNREILFDLFKRADELRKNPSTSLNGKILATLFYEPSTRTRLSFESAMIRLGGKVVSTENAKEFSSAIKGESIEDSIRVISGYSDCIVMRHNKEGAAFIASKVSKVPIINAGDGKGQHPTQAILDVYTIYKEIKRLDKLKIAMVGDLSTGRTIRSLCYLLGKFNEIEIIFVSPENLRIRGDIKEYLRKLNIKFTEEENLDEILPKVDVVYMTRIQKERMSLEDYGKADGKYVINKDNFELINENSIIMHPLPHVEEIDLSIDVEERDRRIAYFRQAENGLYIRMALLDLILNKKNS